MQTINLENLGPMCRASITLPGPGVTVVTAPNGAGKSILLDGVSKLASNCGKLPLKDGESRGSIEGFGARISLGRVARHTGELAVTHLEGRFDLATLVDPGHKDAKSCDKVRIKALVTLMGVKATPALFAEHPALGGESLFHDCITASVLESDDVVEMSGRIKRDYESKARFAEDAAKQELGKATGLEETTRLIDVSLEHDAQVLQIEYEAALAERSRLHEQARNYAAASQQQQEARTSLQTAQANYKGPSVAEAALKLERSQEVAAEHDKGVEVLRLKYEQAVRERDAAYIELKIHREALGSAREYQKLVEACQQTLAAPSVPPVLEGELTEIEGRIIDCRQAMEQGAVIRQALQQQEQARQHRQRQQELLGRAEAIRAAASNVDQVLSEMIHCAAIRVESQEGTPRLVVDHPQRGKSKPYHELSEGERWKIAIDIAADQVGPQGLIVLRQEAYESLDWKARQAIHEHAVAREVYILTAEASHNPTEPYSLVVKHLSAGEG